MIPAALIVFVAILLIRAANFKPKAQPTLSEQEEQIDTDRAVEALCTLVRCKTISYTDSSLEDDAEFEKLISLLPSLYPNVDKTCEVTVAADQLSLAIGKEGQNVRLAAKITGYKIDIKAE